MEICDYVVKRLRRCLELASQHANPTTLVTPFREEYGADGRRTYRKFKIPEVPRDPWFSSPCRSVRWARHDPAGGLRELAREFRGPEAQRGLRGHQRRGPPRETGRRHVGVPLQGHRGIGHRSVGAGASRREKVPISQNTPVGTFAMFTRTTRLGPRPFRGVPSPLNPTCLTVELCYRGVTQHALLPAHTAELDEASCGRTL